MSFTLVSGSKVENRLSIIQRKKVRYKNEYLTYSERKGIRSSVFKFFYEFVYTEGEFR